MKDRSRRRDGHSRLAPAPPSSRRSIFAFLVFLSCALLSVLTFSAFRLFGVSFRPVLISTWQHSSTTTTTMSAISGDGDDPFFLQEPQSPPLSVRDAVSFPDQVLLFLNPPPNITTIPDLQCLYYPTSSPLPKLQLPPISFSPQLLRCPVGPRGFAVSLSPSPFQSPPLQPHHWDHLSYAALLDTDDSTVVFAKGLNLRPGRLSDPLRYECVFGWDFTKPKYLLVADAITAAQEVFRCKTPLSVLRRLITTGEPPLVSITVKGHGGFTLPSIARPDSLPRSWKQRKKVQTMCVCTMVRNQARFIREWIMYHSSVGIDRWFIYDNNSEDEIEEVINSLSSSLNYNISHHLWPWIKTQEAGFAHCALRARDSCEWVGFIDVDEYLHFPANFTLHDVLQNYSAMPWIGELRTPCHSFGPSGLKTAPAQGVTVGYTCRMSAPERHKSIVRTEALNPSLINIVHHFHLKEGMRYVNMERGVMVINHYKYQVWEVFKEKFYRRVATYVADWKDEENVGSKDRAPGLGTKAVEPLDWSSRFCEVHDSELRDRVMSVFVDSKTGLLPW